MKNTKFFALSAVAAVAMAATPALAHTGLPGHEHAGLAAGLLHPLNGLDHLLAMVAVGLWSALAAKGVGSKMWLAPVAFVTAMLLGAAAGFVGIALPLVETGIALSLVALGLMIIGRVELPAVAGASLIALFAVLHGHAHGAEAAGSIALYMAGFTLTTAALHVSGILLGTGLLNKRVTTVLMGSLIAAAGTYFLAA
ncbi:MAG: HupE/UreJ family protein [Hyphomicrobium sp.]|jgi:urease accessory protein